MLSLTCKDEDNGRNDVIIMILIITTIMKIVAIIIMINIMIIIMINIKY